MKQNTEDKEPGVDVETREDNEVCRWLKDHPSMIISVISAIVLTLSFIFKAVIYRNEGAVKKVP